MIKKTTIIIALILTLSLVGCKKYQTVTNAQLGVAKAEWSEPKVSIWYYVGSKDGYHHYLHHDLPGDHLYRISETELNQAEQFPVTRNRKKWEVMPWGVHAIKQGTQQGNSDVQENRGEID